MILCLVLIEQGDAFCTSKLGQENMGEIDIVMQPHIGARTSKEGIWEVLQPSIGDSGVIKIIQQLRNELEQVEEKNPQVAIGSLL